MIRDFVGITFWVATASMLASSVFFLWKEEMLSSNGEHHLL
jgi:hypothetical protein